MWLMLCLTKKYRPKPEHKDIDRYKPFERIDMDKWNWPLTFLTHCFFWPRFLIGQFFILLACIGSVLLTKCCVKKGNRPGPTLNYINGLMLAFASGSALIALTTYCWRRKKREYCYKKWLGEDWVLDKENGYKNAGTFVANH